MDTAVLVALLTAGSALGVALIAYRSDRARDRDRVASETEEKIEARQGAELEALQRERDAAFRVGKDIRDELLDEIKRLRDRVDQAERRLDDCEQHSGDAHRASQIAYAERDEWRQRFIDLEAKVAGLEP